jgi:hypothetical protein
LAAPEAAQQGGYIDIAAQLDAHSLAAAAEELERRLARGRRRQRNFDEVRDGLGNQLTPDRRAIAAPSYGDASWSLARHVLPRPEHDGPAAVAPTSTAADDELAFALGQAAA